MNSLGRRLAAASSSCTSRTTPRWAAGASWRSVHTRRELPYKIEDGVGDFLPPPALKTISDWQEGLLSRLNEEVKGTEYENKSVVQTIISTAADRNQTLAFNYASQALNNSFFLDRLKPPPAAPSTDHEDYMGSSLGEQIRREFGSLSQFKSTFAASALGMAGSGWVWLVTDGKKHLGVLPTFGAGTLLVRSRRQTAGEPLVYGEVAQGPRSAASGAGNVRGGGAAARAGSASPVSGAARGAPPALDPLAPSRALHASAPASLYDSPPGIFSSAPMGASGVNPSKDDELMMGDQLYPLLCVSVHEHAWLSAGLGVWGKEEYLKRFWTAVDWLKVTNDYNSHLSSTTSL